jgi:hypothetical protein
LADGIEFAAFRAFDLKSGNARITAKGSNANREALTLVDYKEPLAADFVSN